MTSINCDGINQPHKQFAIGKAALVHSIEHVEYPSFVRKANRKSFPKGKEWNKDREAEHLVRNKLVRFCSMENTYHIISIENIVDTAFVIPYEHMDKSETYLEGRATSVMVLTTMSLWHNHFIDYEDEELIEEAKKRKDIDVLEDDERFPFEG